MRCEKCGSKLVSGAKFCNQCGNAASKTNGGQSDQESDQTKKVELVGGAMSDEKILLENDQAFVSTTRVVVGETTYSLANITSVSKEIEASTKGCGLIVAFFGLALVAVAFNPFSTGGIIFGLVVGGVGLLWYAGSQRQHAVTFKTSSGSSEVIKSPDEELVDKIVSAVNEAIITRG